MFFGNLENLAQDRKVLAGPLVKALEYLKNTEIGKLPVGRYEIEGTKIFALVQEYQTSPWEKKKAETHQKFIDVQYVYQGVEVAGYSLTDTKNVISENKLAEKDAAFYGSVEGEKDLILSAGRYAIFFPTDIHRPGCNFETEHSVKKVVIKVAVDLL
ncbi:MAG TPA: YhcH/YjgK/YiaL family protein [Firmicutes bacterium]|jgi:biofilm protein TabA|nr:YhcH/YjgK/YiaL family protein [Bacillota bacterium]